MAMRPASILAVATILFAFVTTTAHAKPVTFDFEDQAFGAVAPLTTSNSGLTANFASPTDPGSFAIGGGFYKSLTGNYLAGGADFSTGNTLTITFSQGVRAITLDFATDTAPTLSLLASNGDTASATGETPSGFYFFPEGVLSYKGDYFKSVTLSSPALTFAIDNVTATVPEPAAFALFGLAIAGAGIARRRATTRNS